MLRLTDTTGARLGYLSFDLSDGETSATIHVRVLPADGYFLKAAPADSDVEIQARRNGTMDAFVDISTSPIDLSGLTPEVAVQYDVKAIAANDLVDVRRVVINLAVARSTPAAWAA